MRDFSSALQAERMVFGSILYDPECLDEIALVLKPEDFYRDSHQRLFSILVERRRSGQSCLYPDVHLYLVEKGLEDKVARIDELREFMDSVPSSYLHAEYAHSVLAASKRRQQILAAQEYLAKLQDPDEDIDDLAGSHARKVEDIRISGTKLRAEPLGKIARDAVHSMRMTAQGQSTGLPTPWPELDRLIGGLDPGRLIVLAGRPGTGKSSAAMNIVRRVAGEGLGVYVVSLEMSNHELGVRQLSGDTNIWNTKLFYRPDDLRDHEWARLDAAAAEMDNLPVWIDHTGSKSVDDILDESRAFVKRHDVRLVVVDHIGIVTETKAQKRLTRQQFIGEVTRSLKSMAKDLGIPVLALSQLNRDVEKREDRRPRMSDLRESGNIEQDADVVMMLYGGKDNPGSNETELLIHKNRCGATGMVPLVFDANTTTFRAQSTYCGNTVSW